MRQMRTVRFLTALVGAVLAAALLSGSAFAAGGGYVPAAGTRQVLKNGNWVQAESFRISYRKDGRITKYTTTDAEGTRSDSYSWKGDYVKKNAYAGSGGYSCAWTWTYKKGKLQKYSFSDSDGDAWAAKAGWKKKKAAVSFTVTGSSYKMQSGTLKMDGKGRITSETRSSADGVQAWTSSYYGNGLLKKRTYREGAAVSVTSWNKKGYITSVTDTAPEGNHSMTYTYVMDKKKKCPKEVLVTYNDDGDIRQERILYTKWKKVSRVRNCDAAGTEVPLG